MCPTRFKYANLMWKHINEYGHHVSNADHYADKPDELDKANKRNIKLASKQSEQAETQPTQDIELPQKAEDFFKQPIGPIRSIFNPSEKSQSEVKDKRLIKFVTNQHYMEEKFKQIETLQKKVNTLKCMLHNPETTILLMIDLIEGECIKQKEIKAKLKEPTT